MSRIPVYVFAEDPISQAGVVSQLRPHPEVCIVEQSHIDTAQVAVVVTDVVDEATLRVLRAVQRDGVPRTVLVAGKLDEGAVVDAVEAGVSALLRRPEATAERLVRIIGRVAAGEAELPADLLARLFQQVGRIQRQVLAPRGMSLATLSDRETQVLRLMADGMGTAEIARHLSFSERTIKGVVHDITMRLQVRNRTHAVAYAVREGLI
jgi:DNA-binding NarL/FixJ family response regulator